MKLESLLKRLPKRAKQRSAFVLSIGDEGGILLQLSEGMLLQRWFAESPEAPEAETFFQAMATAPHIPVTVLFDVADQTYVQQTLPPVSRMSTGKLMKQRLARDFSEDYITRAVLIGREKTGRRDWQFMMIALSQSPLVTRWLTLVIRAGNRCTGLYMLPYECMDVARLLNHHHAANTTATVASAWQCLISYNRLSGLRQMVFRNGEMVLTRLSPSTPGETPPMLAGVIEQEVSNTIEYLRRMFYQEFDRMDISVILPAEVKPLVDLHKFDERHHLFTPYEAATALALEGIVQEADRYGDALLSAYIVLRGGGKLAFANKDIRQLQQFYTAQLGMRAAAVLIGLGLLYVAQDSATTIWSLQDEVQTLQQKYDSTVAVLKETNAKITVSPEELERILGVTSIYQQQAERTINPVPFLQALSKAFPSQVRVSRLDWGLRPATTDKKAVGARAAQSSSADSGPMIVSGELTLLFNPMPKDSVALQQSVYAIINTLKTSIPNFQWALGKLPGMTKDTAQTELLMGSAQPGSAQAVKGDALVTITFTQLPPSAAQPPGAAREQK